MTIESNKNVMSLRKLVILCLCLDVYKYLILNGRPDFLTHTCMSVYKHTHNSRKENVFWPNSSFLPDRQRKHAVQNYNHVFVFGSFVEV